MARMRGILKLINLKSTVFSSLSISIFLSLTGCVSVSFYPATKTVTETINPTSKFKGGCYLQKNEYPVNRSSIIESKGPPEEINIDNGKETLYYHKNTLWTGAVVMIALLPVPLLVPANMEYCEFEVVDGNVIKGIKHKGNEVYSFSCGWVFTGNDYKTKLGCISNRGKRPAPNIDNTFKN